MSAYMLVYVESDSLGDVQKSFSQEEVSHEFLAQLQEVSKVREELRQKEIDALLTISIYVSTQDGLNGDLETFSRDIFTFAKLSSFSTFDVKKTESFLFLKPRFQEFTQVPADLQIYWFLDGDKAIPVKEGMEKLSVGDVLGSTSNRILVLNKDLVTFVNQKQVILFDILILVRYYTPVSISDIQEKSPISFVGLFLTSASCVGSSLFSAIEEKLNLSAGILTFYFMKNDDLMRLNPNVKLKDQGLSSGSVICASIEGFPIAEDYPFPTLPLWYTHVLNRVQLHLCSLDNDLSKSAYLDMDLSMLFSEVISIVSSFLNVTKDQLVLIGHDPIRGVPKSRPFLNQEASGLTLRNMLTTMAQTTNILYYNLKEDAAPSRKRLRVTWYNENVCIDGLQEIQLPMNADIGVLKEHLAELKNVKKEQIRVLYVKQGLINTIYENKFRIMSLPTSLNGEPMPLRAEAASENELESKEGQSVRVCHFTKGDIGKQLMFFGDPFVFFANFHFTVNEFKALIKWKLGLLPSEINELKFCILKQGKVPRYLKDDQQILHNATTGYHPKFQEEDHFGIEHPRAPVTTINSKIETMSKSSRESGISIRDV
eukprot:TRINITY_DN1197_c0_g1_i1.p1 TRINITY_DN1197_c0_g1~~TRINITY_DN1197_c0_g1_i1.p1  ORF type:complete len:598 (+),score=158.89 TRINITY_DN1197_c0_g1_i1:4557-6350(+)